MLKSMRNRLYWAFLLMLILPVSLTILAGCTTKQNNNDIALVFTSLSGIPGITTEEIKAVEELRKKYNSFSYGSLASTEAFYNADGEIRGYSVIFCEWLNELFGIEFIPEILEWGEMYPKLKTDFSGDFIATEYRKTELGYFFTGAIAERSFKYFRIAGSRPRSEIIKERPLKLGFLEGSTTAVAAIAALNETSVPFEAFYFNNNTAIYRSLLNEAIDAFINEMVAEAAYLETGNVVTEDFLPLIIEPVSFTAQNPELEPIINIVQKILNNGGTDFLTDLYDRGMGEYTRHKFFLQLHEQERDYLRKNSKVAFLAEYDNYPICFYNENDMQWQGVAIDILNEISILTGLDFKPINEPGVSFSDLMRMLEYGEGAMISELIRNSSREGRFLWPNNDILKDNFIAISLDATPNTNVHRIRQLKVGLLRNSAYADLFYKWFPSHPNVTEYENTTDAFNRLEKGEIDLLMLSVRNLLIATNYNENPAFKANIVFDYTFGSPFGFNRNEETLCRLIDKAMSIIDTETISSYWMRKTFDYRTKIIKSQRPWLFGIIILSFSLIILMFVLFIRNRNAGKHLDKMVMQRTEELDISRQKLSSALKFAENANNAKSNFLATMSHEIRTPMNAIVGIAQINLQKTDLPVQCIEAFDRIYISSSNLLGIINDILDMSKIETGKLDLNPVEYDVPSLINDTVQLNLVRIGSKPVEFILEIDENLPSRLVGDELRLKQILNNLLSNAIKYTEKGYVKLKVNHLCSGNEICLRFIIKDTGQGMKEEDKQRLFSEYTRFNIEANRGTEGTGLGLVITKTLIQMMDGTIGVKSEYGKGSTFGVKVKQKAVSCPPIGSVLARQLCNFKYEGNKYSEKQQIFKEPMPYGNVLVVDDLDTNLFVARGLMEPYQLNIETVKSGFETIDLINKGNRYDIIFMDHMMPEMDGIETTKKIRQLGYTGVIVALTANALVGNDAMFRKNGFDGYISKPIDINHLDACLIENIRDPHLEKSKGME